MKNILKRIVVPLCLLLFFVMPTAAKEPIRVVEGKVVKVSDGDTIQVVTADGTKLKARLYGIDAPETPKVNRRTGKVNKPGQPYGEEAERALTQKIAGKTVRLEIMDIDQYKRMVSRVVLDGRDINREMVGKGGHGRISNIRNRRMRRNIEAERLGLWQQDNPQPPWESRRALRY